MNLLFLFLASFFVAPSVPQAPAQTPAPVVMSVPEPQPLAVRTSPPLTSLATDISIPRAQAAEIPEEEITKPMLEPSAYYVKEGSVMTARARGFLSYEQVQLRRGTKTLDEETADKNGNAVFEFKAPLLGVTFEITALGLTSDLRASRIITLAQQ